MITLCNYGEPATDLSILFNLDHPDGTMQSPNVDVGSLAFDECRSVSGLVFEITGYSGWGSAAELTGIWTDGTGTGTIEIAMSLHGRDFYIDAGIGNDQSGDGSPVNPLKTIGRGRDLSRGSRLHPVTIRPLAGTYSTASNGETFPLWLEEYEDLRGVGRNTIILNDTAENMNFIQPSRTSSLSDLFFQSEAGPQGIKINSSSDVIYKDLYSIDEYGSACTINLYGSTRLRVEACEVGSINCNGSIPLSYLEVMGCNLYSSMATGSSLWTNNHFLELPTGKLMLFQSDDYPENTVIDNLIEIATEIHNVNVFTDNICAGVLVETSVDLTISRNVNIGNFATNESSGHVTYDHNTVTRMSGSATSYSCWWSTAPTFINCISIPFVFYADFDNNWNASYCSFELDGCVALFSKNGVDHPYCWRTRNSVLYYLSEGNAACANTHYSDLMDCPEPTNLDEDPGFVGIARITDIGPDWFSDDTAAWEPGRYAGYYVNPNIYGNGRLFYCVGNSSDMIYVMGDPRTAAEIGDLFVIPDVRLRRIADGFAFDSPLIDAGDPDELDPDGTRRDIGSYGGPYALTPMPVIPTWPPPDQTPTPVPTDTSTPTPTSTPSATSTPTATPSPVASETPTQTPSITGVTIAMPSHWFHPGNPCYCTVTVTNVESVTLTGYPLFVILDVYGLLFFAPSFTTTFETYPGPWNPGETIVEALPSFSWPDTGTSASGILWYAALVDPTGTFIVGEWDSFEFGWEDGR